MALLAVTSMVVVGTGAPSAHAEDGSQKVLFLLDLSGSMNDPIRSGGSKLDAAKAALKQVAAALPAGTQVGLRVFGSQIAEPQATNPAACRDTDVVLPIGPLDQGRMDGAVDAFTAKGETPISYSLRESVNDLGPSGKRTLIFISDGQENCGGDPCATAAELTAVGVDLQFNAIGLDVDATARQQLQCIVKAGNGSYYDANQASDLAGAVTTVAKRALRPFAVTGTPVQGAATATAGPALAAGQYVDAYAVGGAAKYYRIPREPGGAVTVSLAAVVQPFGLTSLEKWEAKLATPSGTTCQQQSFTQSTVSWRTVVSGAITVPGPQTAGTAPTPCQSEPLVLSLARTSGNPADTPVELVVATEAPIANLATLPAALPSFTASTQAVADQAAQPTTGGITFSDAPTLTPGSWTDQIAWGEQVFYRVRLDYGQTLRVTANTPTAGQPATDSDTTSVRTTLALFSASRVLLTRADSVLMTRTRPNAVLTSSTPQVRVRNRFTTGTVIAATSTAGEYYASIAVVPTQADQNGRLMPIQLNVAVDGTPSGQPAVAASDITSSTTSGTASPTTPPTDATAATGPVPANDTTNPSPVLVTLAVLVLAAVAAIGWLVWRRRRRDSDAPGPVPRGPAGA